MNEQPQYYRVELISVKPDKRGWVGTIVWTIDINSDLPHFSDALWSESENRWIELNPSSTHWLKPLSPEEGVWMSKDKLDEIHELLSEIGKGRFSTNEMQHCKNTVEDAVESANKIKEILS